MRDVLDLLERLVAIDSTSDRSNLPVIDLVTSVLEPAGVPATVLEDPSGEKANLVARIGPEAPGGVVLSGHTDCVPVDDQPWTRDPFRAHVQDGALFGRGTADMKGFLALVLATVPEAVRAPLQRPLLLVLTHDEEIGTVGAPAAVQGLLATQPRPAAVIVGEPTSLRPVMAHKGVRVVRTVVTGRDAHSSRPDAGASALLAAARIVELIEEVADRHRRERRDERFDPPHTTFNVGRLTAGQAVNIVPGRAELWWELRPTPGVDADEVLAELERAVEERVLPGLRAATDQVTVTFEAMAEVRPLDAEPHGAAGALTRRLTGYDGPDETIAFGTDGGHFQAAGLSTVVCGPGSIEQAHQPDEWIALDQLSRGRSLVRGVVEHLCT